MPFATHRNTTEAKVWKSPPKKPTVKNWRDQKSVEKMQARGKTCFLQHTKKHYLAKSEKKCPKNRTTNETHKHKHKRKYCPKLRPCITWWWYSGTAPHPRSHFAALKPLHGGLSCSANLNHKYLSVDTQNATLQCKWQPNPLNTENAWRICV